MESSAYGSLQVILFIDKKKIKIKEKNDEHFKLLSCMFGRRNRFCNLQSP
jgi:hypothetical protein